MLLLRLLLPWTALVAAPQDPAALDVIPQDALLVAEAADPAGTVAAFLESRYWRRFREGPLGEEFLNRPETQRGLLGLRQVARTAGADPLELLQFATGGGAAFAWLPAGDEPQFLLVLRALDPNAAQDAINTALRFATEGARSVEGVEWRLPGPRGVLARREQLFFLASAAEALDRLAPDREQSMAAVRSFQESRAATGGGALHVWVGPAALTVLGQGIPGARLENAGASLLLGGMAAVLEQAEWLGLRFALDERGVELSAVAPADADALRKSHAPFFPAAAESELPQVPGLLATWALRHDLGPWWTARDSYLTAKGMADTVEADGNLTTVFQRDFGPEVLHHLEPELRFVAARAPFASSPPDLELPAAAVGVRVKPDKREELEAGFYNAFQLVVNVTNFERGGMSGEALMVRLPEVLDDGSALYATNYAGLDDARVVPPRYNLSPALLLRPDGEVWLSSSTPLLRSIAAVPRRRVAVNGQRLEIDLGPGRAILHEDREALLSQTVLEQGGDLAAAQLEVGRIFAAAELFDRLFAETRLQDGRYTVRARLECKPD